MNRSKEILRKCEGDDIRAHFVLSVLTGLMSFNEDFGDAAILDIIENLEMVTATPIFELTVA